MEIFSIQLKLLKFAGISKTSSTRMKMLNTTIKVFNLVNTSVMIVGFMLYALKSRDLLQIAGNMASVFTSVKAISKYAIFCAQADDFLGVIDEIKSLNEECE